MHMDARTHADCTILLVDDGLANLDLLEELLSSDGYSKLVRVSDAREAMPAFDAHAPDLVLLDLHMPHVSGFDILRQIRGRTAPGDYRPVLVLTADAARETRMTALAGGAQDFLTKPLDAIEVRLRARNLLATRLLHLEQRRLRQAAEAETAARETILSVVAHDLRNPLASIGADAEMIRHMLAEDEHPAQSRTAARIERTVGRMQLLIGDLLDVTRAGHDLLQIRAEPMETTAVLGEADAMLQPLAHAAGVNLVFAGPSAPPRIVADAARVIQLISNLVGNAVRFTPPGGMVRVEWSIGEEALEVRVSDTGCGVAPERVAHLFQGIWERGGPGSTLGLGLVIARAIVAAHGGSIRLESTSAAGTTFVFALPVAPSPQRLAPLAAAGDA